jgi:CHC2-type zinc finger protein
VTATTFGPARLPASIKKDLCRELLAEFGATRVTVREHQAEMDFCCVLPWHEERRPSAGLNWEKLTYSCFSCGSSGGLLWLIGSCRGVTEVSARRWLESESGLGDDVEDVSKLVALIDAIYAPKDGRSRAPIPKMSERVLTPWRAVHPWVTDPPTAAPPGRGIPLANAIEAQVGYAPEYRVKDDDGREVVSERVVIPHFWRGKLVGWQSRRLSDDGTPKYISTADFPKDRTIYRPPEGRTAVVVESPFSVLRHLHHLPITATFGAKVTPSQVRLLAEYDRVVLWMDPDRAGWEAVEGHDEPVEGERRPKHVPGLVERLEPYCDVRVVETDWYADAAEFDEEEAAELVAAAAPASTWRRPTALRCRICREVHSGPCA